MDTAKLVAHWLLIFGVSSASLYLISNFTIAPASLCMPLHSSLPAIRSTSVEYLCYTWGLLSRGQQDHSQGPLLAPRNLFLLVNLIILFILTSLHLQQRAASRGNKRRKSRRQHTGILINDRQVLLQGSSLAGLAGQEARGSMESLINEALAKEESLSYNSAEPRVSTEISAADDTESTSDHITSGSLARRQGSPTVNCDRINGPDVEKIVLEEDGRLRLIGGPPPTSETTSHPSHEDRDSTNGSDAGKIVLEEDGRLRLFDRPLPSSRCRAEKSHSTPDPGDDYNHNYNYDIDNNPSGINHYNNPSFNDNYNNNSNLRGLNNDDNHTLIKDDLGNYQHSLIKGDHSHDAQQLQPQEAQYGKGASSVLGNVSRPKKKKSESMDATWKAINDNSRGSAMNGSRDPRRMISRQNSRHGFKAKARPPVRREPSISQEELNAKVESFIERFNEQIRIQRQQSLLSYMQMVDRGA